MRFSAPLYLLLLIPVVLGLLYSYPRVRGIAKPRKRIAFGLRFLLATALVFALAGLETYHRNHGVCTIFLVDRSDSIREGGRQKQDEFIRSAAHSMADDDEMGLVVFGKQATIDAAPTTHFQPARILTVVDGSSTDISAAVRLASASFPEGKSRRIVVLSDGNETAGDAEQAAEVAGSTDTPIDFVPLGQEGKGEVSLERLDAPNQSRIGEPFQVKVSVDSDIATEGKLALDRDGVQVKRLAVALSPGKNVFAIDQTLLDPGFHRFRATIDARGDTDPRNNLGMSFVAIKPKPRVLILQSHPISGDLAAALKQQSVDCDVRNPSGIPSRVEEIQNYDAVILNDLNAADITPNQMKLLRSSVRDTGIGLAMIGGEESFLPGGWFGTPVADALPVDMELKKRESFPSTSVLIICDTSGSMGMIEDGVQKVKLAAKAAAMTIQMMPETTRVGVVASTDGIEFVCPMQPATNKAAMMDQTMQMDVGGGGIYAKPSMDFAITHLEQETTKVRHLILMADGSDVDLRDGCFEIAARMRAEHITTSCVAIGDGQYVPFLRQLAAVGGGRFYLALHGNQLPAVFTQDAAVMARSAIEEGAFFPKVSVGEKILRGISTDTMPPLYAYDVTAQRPLANTGMKTQKDDPLLATWQYGLGTSLAFTSDAQPRWAAKWVPWGGFGQFWAQAVREISRTATSNRYQLQADVESSQGTLQVHAADEAGNPLNDLQAKVKVALPDGSAVDVPLAEKAPGLYTGSFPANQIGSYIATIAEPGPNGTGGVMSSGFSISYPAEYRSFRPNLPLLQSIAQESGGAQLAQSAGAFRGATKPGFSIQELWPQLLLLSAILLPLDVAVRRLALPLAEAWAMVLAWLSARRRRAVTPASAPAMERLQRAKQRAGRESDAPPAVPSSPSSAPASRPEPRRSPVGAAPASTSSRLLEAKKKRKTEE